MTEVTEKSMKSKCHEGTIRYGINFQYALLTIFYIQ